MIIETKLEFDNFLEKYQDSSCILIPVLCDELKKSLGNIGENKLLLITAIKMVDDYFDLLKKVKNTKSDFEKVSIKFNELRYVRSLRTS